MKNLGLIALGLAAAAFILGGIVAVESIPKIIIGSRAWLLTCVALLLTSIALSQLEIVNRLGKK